MKTIGLSLRLEPRDTREGEAECDHNTLHVSGVILPDYSLRGFDKVELLGTCGDCHREVRIVNILVDHGSDEE